jgi:hypothetical protein
MSNLFLDPKKPLFTCSSTNCQGCPVQNHLECHFNSKDLMQFLAIASLPFIFGGIGIAKINAWLLIPWIGIILGYFGLVEIRVMCSHCPHYAEPEPSTLKCWANYGSPKLWKYRPGPLSTVEKMVFYAGLILIAGYPLAFLILGAQWLLLILFSGTILGLGSLLRARMCNRCMNFACPLNRVEPSVRALFFAKNPTIAKAWKAELS